MAKNFTSWTVLPHDPIEKLSENVWRVSGKMPDGKTQRQMVIGKRKDGRLVVHNGIALGEDDMKALGDFGEMGTLVVPNGFHRQDAFIWKQRFPKLKVVTPGKSRGRVAKVVEVDTPIEGVENDDDTVKIVPLDGVPIESVMEVRSKDGLSLVFTDAVMNMPKLSGMIGFMLAPTGQVAMPRLLKLMGLRNKKAFLAQLERYASDPDLVRVLPGHGAPITTDPRGALRTVITQLGG